ncbi:MAG: polyprenyl synthetase family protein [Christensenellales bacterium]|jgi:geranylgeranyl diphosphate synthase type II
MKLSEYKLMIDRALPSFLPEHKGYAKELYEAMSYGALAPGKRLRPSLLMLGAELSGANSQLALPFACAVEMIHAYSLIHDDLPCMDDDDLRRGRPTCHKVYGEAIALLAGDALLSHAFETMLSVSLGANTAPEIESCLKAMGHIAKCAGASGMVAGQTADMLTGGINEEIMQYIHINKTGKLIEGALVGGLLLGGASEGLIKDFQIFAENLGVAFQLTDDILDVTGDTAILGKSAGSDSAQQKKTAVALWGLEGTKARAESSVEAAKAAIAGYQGAQELLTLADSLLGRQY